MYSEQGGHESGREDTYQWMLRALGAHLDEEPSCRITLAEGPDGFLVRLQRHLHKLEPLVYVIRRETLRKQLAELGQARKPAGLRARHQGVWALFPNGHQDFFRALGYELDQRRASMILVDELEDGIVVTYRSPDEERPGEWRKEMFVLGPAEIEDVLNAAFERRKTKTADREPGERLPTPFPIAPRGT